MPLGNRFYLFLVAILVYFPAALQSQVNAEIDLNRQVQGETSIIGVRWSTADEKVWHDENDGRLDILGLKANISSNSLTKSKSGVSTYRFEFDNSCTVEMVIQLISLVPGETLYLKNATTGKVVFQFSSDTSVAILTPAFDPSEVILEWNCGKGAAYKSEFRVTNIYYQPSSSSRSFDIGFGTSFPCHPNAACKEDSMMQLISKSTVRIRMVMEEGIGWCSGSMINNVRNDKTPYLLTAFHCQYEYTPKYKMWRFDFNYTSPTCTNPAEEPAYTSLEGCDFMALGQASDFLLVRLAEPIPVNQEVTFVGWDRDELTIPDTSYFIHHPNADIRKFSSCTNKATIHPNQIGWSEGYTTPANHHFKFKFTEGGHEPGSSGGPLFNEDFYLVGQLHGGTAGCETSNNTFIGRFAKSWNLGANPDQRLSDWLDPDQTNLLRIPAIENFTANDVVDIHGVVKDPLGRPLKNALIKVTGAKEENIFTGADGTFTLAQVSRSGQYTLTPEKNDNPTNGLNALDLVAIQKHLLGKDTFNLPWKFIAADATNNIDLTVGDIVLLLRLMLGKIQTLPSSPSWRFDPPQLVIDPSTQGEPIEVQFMGIKIGDLNASADPGK
ncbi:MAG TPA: carboxypeptidase regulatory-like domain-containing protein [Saprospiraceae bacterium]